MPALYLLILFESTIGYTSSGGMSEHQKRRAELFLRHMMIEENCLYTLLGSKPVTLFSLTPIVDTEEKKELYSVQSDQFRKHVPIKKYHPTKKDLQKLWNDWQKVQSLHLGDQFLINTDENLGGFFINKLSTIYILEMHRKEFEEYFGESFKPEKVLHLIGNGESAIWEKIKKNDYLLGLLLGYGAKNAFYFSLEKKLNCNFPQRRNSSDSPLGVCLPIHKLEVEHLEIPPFISYQYVDEQVEKYIFERAKIIELYKDKEFYKFTTEILQGNFPKTPHKELSHERLQLFRNKYG